MTFTTSLKYLHVELVFTIDQCVPILLLLGGPSCLVVVKTPNSPSTMVSPFTVDLFQRLVPFFMRRSNRSYRTTSIVVKQQKTGWLVD